MKTELEWNLLMAGAHRSQARVWLRLARDAKRDGIAELVTLRVGFARQCFHDYLTHWRRRKSGSAHYAGPLVDGTNETPAQLRGITEDCQDESGCSVAGVGEAA